MTTFLFEIDIELKRNFDGQKIKIEKEFARLALARRITMGMNETELISIVDVWER